MADDNDKNKKGFSGLSDLASNVSGIDEPINLEPTAEVKPSMLKQPPQPQREVASSESERKTTSSPPPIETVSSSKSSGGSRAKWTLGIIGIIFVSWLIHNAQQSNKKPLYTPPLSSQSNSYPQSIPAPALQTPSTTQSAGLQYTKPSVGTNYVLSIAEIRWCIREGIRIEAMRDVIDKNAGIDEFNSIVNNYNSRCGNYRYRKGSQSRAESDVEAYRSQIVAEAIREARQMGRSYQTSYPSVSLGVSTSTDPKKPNAQYTREAQQLLIDLGYDPGPVDGDYGRRTADAVRAFQKAQGIVVDGWISRSLVDALRNAIINKSKPHSAATDSQRNIPRINKGFDTSKNISDISDVARVGIIEACKYRVSPENVYSCQQEELTKLKRTGAGPNLSGTVKDTKQKVETTTKRNLTYAEWVAKNTSYESPLTTSASEPIVYRSPGENALIGGFKRALNVTTDIGKNLFTLPSVAIGESQIAGVSQEEWDTYMGMQAKKKQAAALRRKLETTKTNPDTEDALRQQLAEAETVTPEELELSVPKSYDTKERKLIPTASRPRYAELVIKREQNRYIDKGSPYDRIDSFIAQKNYQQKVDEFVEKNLKSEVDDYRMQMLSKDLSKIYRRALGVDEATGQAKNLAKQLMNPNMSTTDILSTLAAGGLEVLADNPEAVIESAIESTPYIATAMASLPLTIAQNVSDKVTENREEYRKENKGNEAIGKAQATLVAASFAAGVFDVVGDRLVGDIGKLTPKQFNKLTKSKIGRVLARPGSLAVAAAGEFVAESGANALSSYAVKQDIDKLDYEGSYVAGMIGFGSGGLIAGAMQTPSTLLETKRKIAIKAVEAKEKVIAGSPLFK